MFEQIYIEERSAAGRRWAMAVSALGQAVVVGGVLLIPLIYTYQLPLHEWSAQMLLFAAPPPPAPPPPPVAKIAPQPKPERFQETLRQPRVIPHQVALDERRVGLTAPPPSVQGVSGGVSGSIMSMFQETMPPPPRPIVIGGRVQAARLLSKAVPTYPVEAIQENISGVVLLRAVIARDGSIKRLTLLSGHPLLAPAAIEAVEQWRYKPTLLNGAAVEVQTEIEVVFRLHEPEPEEDPKAKRRRTRR